jgi:hypothetical protein
MQDSTQAGAAPPDDATPKGGGIPIRLSRKALPHDCILSCGAAGNRTRRGNCPELRKYRIRVRETTRK